MLRNARLLLQAKRHGRKQQAKEHEEDHHVDIAELPLGIQHKKRPEPDQISMPIAAVSVDGHRRLQRIHLGICLDRMIDHDVVVAVIHARRIRAECEIGSPFLLDAVCIIGRFHMPFKQILRNAENQRHEHREQKNQAKEHSGIDRYFSLQISHASFILFFSFLGHRYRYFAMLSYTLPSSAVIPTAAVMELSTASCVDSAAARKAISSVCSVST